ncbi:hypothetical protein AWB82_04451 [Caballeronia glebae]|jgi:hypothetical protein|uniref:Uncharacterized protein n=1 Tax=Caballeronia glebae TaxID=1777143 RepID=A0A158BRE1_9BURK|nr:hypothetical protein AWB82_04451 [Caballeronia glebae]
MGFTWEVLGCIHAREFVSSLKTGAFRRARSFSEDTCPCSTTWGRVY